MEAAPRPVYPPDRMGFSAEQLLVLREQIMRFRTIKVSCQILASKTVSDSLSVDASKFSILTSYSLDPVSVVMREYLLHVNTPV